MIAAALLRGGRSVVLALLAAWYCAGAAASDAPPSVDQAMSFSQSALGSAPADIAMIDSRGNPLRLSQLRGKPVVVSLVFTACAHSCSITTRHIDRVIREARNALGPDSFHVLTIGFDTPVDTPEAMADYARRNGVADPRWHFASVADAAAMQTLMRETGFLAWPSPRGFEHTVQLSLLDRDGVLRRQVYGDVFPKPLLVDPLKQLVWGEPLDEAGMIDRLLDRVRLLCTVYDARGDRYVFDYSLFAGMLIGVLFLGSVMLWLALEMRRARRRARTVMSDTPP